jgi:hypothetical protein
MVTEPEAYGQDVRKAEVEAEIGATCREEAGTERERWLVG